MEGEALEEVETRWTSLGQVSHYDNCSELQVDQDSLGGGGGESVLISEVS